MQIGIDWQSTKGKKTGLGVYTQNLIQHLKKIDRSNQYFLFDWKGKDNLNTPQRFYWDQIGFLFQTRKEKLDLIHKTAFSAPVFSRLPIIYTVADLIGMLYPENFNLPARIYWQRWLPLSIKKAQIIISISEHTKRDVVRLLKIPEEKIKVIYIDCDESFKPIKNQAKLSSVRSKYQLPPKFILSVSTLEPRKNLAGLIEAFNLVKKDAADLKLVIVGQKGWGNEKVFQRIKSLGLAKEIVFTGYVEDDDLPLIYNAAELFVFPSFYEGFGLPVLEALRCGLPVVASDTSSVPEIVGEAGILIEPQQPESIARGLKNLIQNDKLRIHFKNLGLEQAQKFSWEKCAQETLKVYQELAKELKIH